MSRFILYFLLCFPLTAADQPLTDPYHTSIGMTALNLPRPGAISPTPEGVAELGEVRQSEIQHFASELLEEYRIWYRAANIIEMGGKLLVVICPVLSGIAAATKDPVLSIWAMGIGLVGVALNDFSHYAARESAERGEAANRMLVSEGLPPVALLRNASRTSIGNSSPRNRGSQPSS